MWIFDFTLRFFLRCGLPHDLLDCECGLCNLTLKIGRMFVSVIYCELWSGKLKNFCVWMICDVVNVVCHGEIDGCNLYRWDVSIMSCSCGSCIYPDVITLSSLCMNHDDSSCEVCENKIVIWIDFVCPGLHSGALNFIWHGDFWEVWVCDESLGFLIEISCVDNP